MALGGTRLQQRAHETGAACISHELGPPDAPGFVITLQKFGCESLGERGQEPHERLGRIPMLGHQGLEEQLERLGRSREARRAHQALRELGRRVADEKLLPGRSTALARA